jgi:hypothetical protein
MSKSLRITRFFLKIDHRFAETGNEMPPIPD